MLEPKSMPVEIVKSEEAFLIYCNTIEMGLTAWDIRFKLMEIFDRRDDKAVVKNLGTVVMSPAHAKATLEALQQTVKLYEEKFGEIDLARIHEVTAASAAAKVTP